MFDPSTMTGAGLFTPGDTRVTVPLTGISIDADILSFYAKVVVSQRYVNREATPIEAVYVFPLDEGAAVCGFEAIVDGTLVVGEVFEREKAFEMYDDAMEQGHGAFLLDEERPDVFQASVGNLPPGKEVQVKLTYVTELSIADGRLRFAIPTTVSPRYAHAQDRVGTGRPDSEALNPPLAWSVPYGLNLTVHLATGGRISAVECPSHPIALTMNDREATVTLAQQEVALDRDFVLSVDAAGLDAPHAVVERDDEETEAIGVAFAPAFDTTPAPADVIFLVDRSGSMQGASIEEVRNALQLCLRSMFHGCRFDIVGFGSTYEALFPESRPYDQASLDAAHRHVASLQADLGGTELLPALQFVLGRPRQPELPRQIVILTDGEVTNTDAVIALAAEHAADARIFTFGIGAGSSHHLVRGLARAGRGSAEFIYPGERIEPKVVRLFGRLLSPALTDVGLAWTGGIVTQSPLSVPPVFASGRVIVYAFVKQGRPTNVRLTATSPTGPVSFDVPLRDAAAGSGRIVSTLAARARVRELEEGSEWLAARGSQQKDRKASGARNEIIALAMKYGLMSRETSYVAIERRDTPVVGDVKLRRVPVALTTGWGGLQQISRLQQLQQISKGGLRPARMTLGEGPIHMGTYHLGGPHPESIDYESSGAFDEAASFAELRAPAAPLRSTLRRRASAAPRGMQDLIALQAADGSWDLTLELATVMGRDLDTLSSAVTRATGRGDEIRRAWATALAVAWLELHAASARDEWQMLASKARKWLDHTPAVPADGGTWLDFAREFSKT
jgi:Ca-activated chloride channel family protein